MGRPGGSKSGIVMFCILPYKGDPILIIHKLFNPFGFSTFCKDVRLFGTIPKTTDPGDLKYIPDTLSASPGYEQKIKIYSDPLEAIVESLKDKNINNSSLGLELAGLNINIQKMILKGLNKCFFRDCTEIIRLIRMIKTDEEIKLLTRSAELNEIALQETLKHFKDKSISRGSI